MKNRAPRKKKKQAKKLKTAHDAVIMAKSAVIIMQGVMQTAMINSMVNYPPIVTPALKVLKVVEVVQNTATAMAQCTSEFKPWTHFVPNYQIR